MSEKQQRRLVHWLRRGRGVGLDTLFVVHTEPKAPGGEFSITRADGGGGLEKFKGDGTCNYKWCHCQIDMDKTFGGS